MPEDEVMEENRRAQKHLTFFSFFPGHPGTDKASYRGLKQAGSSGLLQRLVLRLEKGAGRAENNPGQIVPFSMRRKVFFLRVFFWAL